MRCALATSLLLLSCVGFAQRVPNRPDGTFVADEANLLSPADKQAVTAAANLALSKAGAPVVVCTIPSLKAMGAADEGIVVYARRVADTWNIGEAGNRARRSPPGLERGPERPDRVRGRLAPRVRRPSEDDQSRDDLGGL